MKSERAYICDGRGCEKMCGEKLTPEEWEKYPCHHTLDEKHAKNKCRRKRKFEYFGDKNKFLEVEKPTKN